MRATRAWTAGKRRHASTIFVRRPRASKANGSRMPATAAARAGSSPGSRSSPDAARDLRRAHRPLAADEPDSLDRLESTRPRRSGRHGMSIPAELEFTGERFVPGVPGEIVYEHVHRYAFARRLATGRRVLDAACGEGYGSALLAQVAVDVIGVDVDGATIAHARSTYPARNLTFTEASVTSIPVASGSIDLVVSFETIEHLKASDQPLMLAEFARVLAPEGVLLVSSPNRPEYSDRR